MAPNRQLTEALGSVDDARRATGRLRARLLTQHQDQSEHAAVALRAHNLILQAEKLLHDDALEEE